MPELSIRQAESSSYISICVRMAHYLKVANWVYETNEVNTPLQMKCRPRFIRHQAGQLALERAHTTISRLFPRLASSSPWGTATHTHTHTQYNHSLTRLSATHNQSTVASWQLHWQSNVWAEQWARTRTDMIHACISQSVHINKWSSCTAVIICRVQKQHQATRYTPPSRLCT